MNSGKSPSSMLDPVYGLISDVVKKSIAGMTIDTSVVNSKVVPEDRETVSNVIRAISMVCNPHFGQGGVSVPHDIGAIISSPTDRQYSIGVSVSGSMLRIDGLVDFLRSCHPNILNVILNIDLDRPRHPVTISVHISCGPRNITDAIYVLSSRPKGSYTSAIIDAINYTGEDDSSELIVSSPASAATAANGHPPPAKKRKRSSSDSKMSD